MGSELRDRARALVRSGALPRVQQERTWAGRGLGSECALCGERITREDVEYELEFVLDGGEKPHVYRFHASCLPVWELARREDC